MIIPCVVLEKGFQLFDDGDVYYISNGNSIKNNPAIALKTRILVTLFLPVTCGSTKSVSKMATTTAILIMHGPELCFCMSNLDGVFIVFVFVFVFLP